MMKFRRKKKGHRRHHTVDTTIRITPSPQGTPEKLTPSSTPSSTTKVNHLREDSPVKDKENHLNHQSKISKRHSVQPEETFSSNGPSPSVLPFLRKGSRHRRTLSHSDTRTVEETLNSKALIGKDDTERKSAPVELTEWVVVEDDVDSETQKVNGAGNNVEQQIEGNTSPSSSSLSLNPGMNIVLDHSARAKSPVAKIWNGLRSSFTSFLKTERLNEPRTKKAAFSTSTTSAKHPHVILQEIQNTLTRNEIKFSVNQVKYADDA
jgi:hypothetical protein